MPLNKDTWVLGIEQEIANAHYKKILWGIILLLSTLFFYFSNKRPDIFGEITNTIKLILLFVIFIAFFRIIISPQNPDYLAYFLYQIGYELPDFESGTSYLKRNRDYIKNCDKQIRYIFQRNFQNSEYFVDNILDFFNKLHDIILRLNHIYSNVDIDDNFKVKLDGMSSEKYITEQEFISSKLMDLSNLIHKEHSSLNQAHIVLVNVISDEIKDIPIKQFQEPLLEYPRGIWNKLHYKVKILIFLIVVFGSIFILLSQILIYYGLGQQSYSTAMMVSGAFTVAAFSKIDLFIAHERAG